MTRLRCWPLTAVIYATTACSQPASQATENRLQECQAHHLMLETAGVEPSMSRAQRLHWCEVHARRLRQF